MFIENKYHRWYFQIIENAQNRILDQYSETHHIIPKCLGGSNQLSNLVKLTAREHFMCHWLLTKFVENNEKMLYALWLMMNVKNKQQDRYKVKSRTYELLKTNLSKTFSNQHIGKKMTDETKRKISETRKKKFQDGTLEIKVYSSTREKLSKNRLGYKLSQETKDKIGNAHRGKVISDAQKQELSDLNTGKTWNLESKKKLSNTLKEDYKSGKRIAVAGMKGKSMPDSAKEKIRNARIEYWKKLKEEAHES